MMIHYTKYQLHNPNIIGKQKKVDNNIYTFDIETSSYYILNDKLYSAIEYQYLTEDEKELCEFRSCMYIWMLSINDKVYYGRNWLQLEEFLYMINQVVPDEKILFIHNLSFEFQYLKSHFKFRDVMARKSHKVMKAHLVDYNFELRCTYMMSGVALKYLPKLYNLPVQKLVGDLDYTLIRTYITPLTEEELGYCENDCLIIYYYILEELKQYQTVNKIPLTSTGHVRRELKEKISNDWSYKGKVKKAINTDPHIYNLLLDAFMGGYTHSNWIFTDEIIKDVDSWDFTSSYPYVMVTHKFPSSEFKPCNVRTREHMISRFAYLMVVDFYDIDCKYYNTFISQSKAIEIKGAKYDNGRVIHADKITLVLTDIDFYFICDTYKFSKYIIRENYYSTYNYLPIQFINFILDKYVNKTQFKGVKGMEVEYAKEKGKFNSLYGMSVTNEIRDEVLFSNDNGWQEIPLNNDEIIMKLNQEKKKGFLSFAYGVWITAYARNNLLRNVIKLDEYCIYCDTDSMKLRKGYDKSVIDTYNKSVEKRIKFVSDLLQINIDRFVPKDSKGVSHMLGIFDFDGHYDEFITQGAKKYAVKEDGKIKITVAGVPKSRKCSIKRFK